MLSLKALREVGFKRSACWVLDDKGKPEVSHSLPTDLGIYLFVVGRKILYVGKADRSLHRRVRRYVGTMRGSERPRKVHKGLDDNLRDGTRVDIYTFSPIDPRMHHWKGLPLDRLTGVAAGLIEKLNPIWNPFNSAGRAKRALLSLSVENA